MLVVPLVLSSITGSLAAQSTHRDADGCYTLTVPAGWRAAQNDRGTVLSAANRSSFPPATATRGSAAAVNTSSPKTPTSTPTWKASGTWMEMKPTK
jgi:hypothetical protein